MVETISEELREKILPNLKEMLDEESWEYIPDIFDEGGIFTYPNGIPLVALHLDDDYPSPQFFVSTGEFAELTTWEYIQTVDAQAQLDEYEAEQYNELVASVLEYYHRRDYRGTADYLRIVEKRTVNADATNEYGETVYEYACPFQPIYLTEEHYPVSWQRQKVDDELEWYMYNFSEMDSDLNGDETYLYTYKVAYDWKKEQVRDE